MDLPVESGSNFKVTSRPLADIAVHGDRNKGIYDFYYSLQRSLSIGPKINFKTPPTRQDPDGIILVEMRENSQLSIDFLKTQAEVDMNSLDVEAKKGLFSVSLTDRLKPYIHGNKLEANKIKIPQGQFTVIIRIADRIGTFTEKAYLFLVEH